jgi:hypothetical protein
MYNTYASSPSTFTSLPLYSLATIQIPSEKGLIVTCVFLDLSWYPGEQDSNEWYLRIT